MKTLLSIAPLAVLLLATTVAAQEPGDAVLPHVVGRSTSGELGLGPTKSLVENFAELDTFPAGVDADNILQVIVQDHSGHAIVNNGDQNDLYCWGSNAIICGVNTTTEVFTPSLVPGLEGTRIESVSTGDDAALMVGGGSVYAIGYNSIFGELGTANKGVLALSAYPLEGLPGSPFVRRAELNRYASMYLDTAGFVYMAGFASIDSLAGNIFGLGTGAVNDTFMILDPPERLPAEYLPDAGTAVDIAMAQFTAWIVNRDGSLYIAGYTSFTGVDYLTGAAYNWTLVEPFGPSGSALATDVETFSHDSDDYFHHVVVTDAEGNLWCGGSNLVGQCGLSSPFVGNFTQIPLDLKEDETVLKVSVSPGRTFFITSESNVYAMGDGTNYLLGTGEQRKEFAPVKLDWLEKNELEGFALGISGSEYATVLFGLVVAEPEPEPRPDLPLVEIVIASVAGIVVLMGLVAMCGGGGSKAAFGLVPPEDLASPVAREANQKQAAMDTDFMVRGKAPSGYSNRVPADKVAEMRAQQQARAAQEQQVPRKPKKSITIGAEIHSEPTHTPPAYTSTGSMLTEGAANFVEDTGTGTVHESPYGDDDGDDGSVTIESDAASADAYQSTHTSGTDATEVVSKSSSKGDKESKSKKSKKSSKRRGSNGSKRSGGKKSRGSRKRSGKDRERSRSPNPSSSTGGGSGGSGETFRSPKDFLPEKINYDEVEDMAASGFTSYKTKI